jgi:hypothetical protein
MAALGLAVLLAACSGGDGPTGVAGKRITSLPQDVVPPTVLGLTVGKEDVSKALAGSQRNYVDAVSVYSFRKGDLLQATLQVSRFIDEARYTSADFRQSLLTRLGGAEAQPVRLGGDNVYLTSGNRQRLAAWFRDRYMFVLTIREDFDRPRTLMREVLQVRP